MKISLKIFIIALCLTFLASASSDESASKAKKNCTEGNCRKFFTEKLHLNDPETVKKLREKFQKSSHNTFEQALAQREAIEKDYQNNIGSGNIKSKIRIPRRFHLNGIRHHNDTKTRLLESTNNQYQEINEGNSYQVRDSNYIYSLRSLNFTIHKVDGAQLTRIHFEYFPTTMYPRELHAKNGYFAIIFQTYLPNTVLVKVYQNLGSSIVEIRSYQKQGIFVDSREYNLNVVVISEIQMTAQNFDYTWNISGIGQVNATVFNGLSANNTGNNLGPAARSIARIPMGPAQNLNYRLATFLFCDFSFDMILSSNLNVFIAGNNYNYTGYTVAVQTFAFNDKPGVTWGQSRWVVLPGLIFNYYSMHEFNNYFRVVTNYVRGDYSTAGQVAVIKVPMSTFDLDDGVIYYDQGIDGAYFVASRFRQEIVHIIFNLTIIKSFSTSFGVTTGIISTNFSNYFLYPYGSQYMIGFGNTFDYNKPAISIFSITGYKLAFKQSLIITPSNSTEYPYAYSSYGWYSTQYLQIDQVNKRFTFPIYSSENEPYKAGYYQVYIDPANNCLSSLPISNPCSSPQNASAAIIGKLFKHWNDESGYDWNTGYSEEIVRSATIAQGGKQILVTASYCQLQARTLLSPTQSPSMQPTSQNTAEVTIADLCI